MNDVWKQLYQVVQDRKASPQEGSYTCYLFDKGLDKILKKVGEESTEVIIAGAKNDKEETIYEVADLAYHLMVMMVEQGITLQDVTAELAKRHFLNALNLFPMPDSGWRPRVYTCSATEGNGLSDIWNGIEDFLKFTKQNGYYQRNRHRQAKYWMYETINEALRENFYRNPQVEAHLKKNEELVLSDKKSSFIAARDLLNDYFDSLKK